jgi:hypothetical protein
MKLTKSVLREIIREELQQILDESVYDAFGSVFGALSSKNKDNKAVKYTASKGVDTLDDITKDELINIILRQRKNTISKSNLQKQSLTQLKSHYLEIK